MLKIEHNAKAFRMMIEDGTRSHHDVEILLIPTIFNGHFHLVVLRRSTSTIHQLKAARMMPNRRHGENPYMVYEFSSYFLSCHLLDRVVIPRTGHSNRFLGIEL